jgi:hypothetical protein
VHWQSHRTMSDASVHKRHARQCKLTAHPKKHTAAAARADRIYRLSWLESAPMVTASVGMKRI